MLCWKAMLWMMNSIQQVYPKKRIRFCPDPKKGNLYTLYTELRFSQCSLNRTLCVHAEKLGLLIVKPQCRHGLEIRHENQQFQYQEGVPDVPEGFGRGYEWNFHSKFPAGCISHDSLSDFAAIIGQCSGEYQFLSVIRLTSFGNTNFRLSPSTDLTQRWPSRENLQSLHRKSVFVVQLQELHRAEWFHSAHSPVQRCCEH